MQKGVGSMAQVIEHLPSKHKALGSNLCTEKKKKGQKESRM
jgi:hypothetical protein